MSGEPRPAPPQYGADRIARFFDGFARHERERLERQAEDRVSYPERVNAWRVWTATSSMTRAG